MPSPFLTQSERAGGLGSLMAQSGKPLPRPTGSAGAGAPPTGPAPMFPPPQKPAPRGPAGMVAPDSRPQPSPTEGGLGAALGPSVDLGYAPGPAMPPGPVGAPVPPVPMPRGPTQPDASGVVPPPNTPGYAPLPVAPLAPAPGTAPVPGGPGRLGQDVRNTLAPVDTSKGLSAEKQAAGAQTGLASLLAPTAAEGGNVAPQAVKTAEAPPPETPATADSKARTTGNTRQTVVESPLSLPDPGKVVIPGLDITPNSGGSTVKGEGNKKTDKGYQDAAAAAGYGDAFDESGKLAKLPLDENGGVDLKFLASIGFGNNKGMTEKITSLPDLFRQFLVGQETKDTQAAAQAQKKILDALQDLKRNGLDLDKEALFNYYTSGEGAATFLPPSDEPAQVPPGVINGVVDPGTGDVTLGSLDPAHMKEGLSNEMLDWISKNPEAGKAILDWFGGLQSRDDRQTAINSFQGGLGDLLKNDPTRNAMYDFLGQGPHYTYDDATINKMKTAGREQYGAGLSSLDQQLRDTAAARGIPTSDLAGMNVQARSGLLGGLLDSERNVDITAAQQRAKDLNDYFSQLNAGQSSLVGPQAAYYGSLANLIAGTPGLAQTGNPLAGVAQFQLDKDLATQGPTTLDRLGAYAGIAGGLGSLLGGGASLLGGRK